MMRRTIFWLANFTPVFMPALSPSMESGVVVEWKKKVGDLVKENEVFCTIQTDKAVVDYTNTFDPGYLAKIFYNNGSTVSVAKTIAVMVDEKEDIAEANSFVPEDGDQPASEEHAPTPAAPAAAAPSGGNAAGHTSEPPDDVDIAPVFMPALSPSMESGVVVEWKKKVGDLVKENEVFCTIQTDKAVVDYTNTFDPGYLAKIYCENGATATVAKTIALLVPKPEDVPKVANYYPEDAAGSGAPTAAPAATPAPAPASASAPASPAKASTTQRYGSSLQEAIHASGPGVIRIAAGLPDSVLESIQPTGKNGRFSKADFVGQKGFDYSETVPIIEKSTGTSSGAPTPSGPISNIVVSAYPVYNTKVDDTKLLQQLIASMGIPKVKKAEKSKKN